MPVSLGGSGLLVCGYALVCGAGCVHALLVRSGRLGVALWCAARPAREFIGAVWCSLLGVLVAGVFTRFRLPLVLVVVCSRVVQRFSGWSRLSRLQCSLMRLLRLRCGVCYVPALGALMWSGSAWLELSAWRFGSCGALSCRWCAAFVVVRCRLCVCWLFCLSCFGRFFFWGLSFVCLFCVLCRCGSCVLCCWAAVWGGLVVCVVSVVVRVLCLVWLCAVRWGCVLGVGVGLVLNARSRSLVSLWLCLCAVLVGCGVATCRAFLFAAWWWLFVRPAGSPGCFVLRVGIFCRSAGGLCRVAASVGLAMCRILVVVIVGPRVQRSNRPSCLPGPRLGRVWVFLVRDRSLGGRARPGSGPATAWVACLYGSGVSFDAFTLLCLYLVSPPWLIVL